VLYDIFMRDKFVFTRLEGVESAEFAKAWKIYSGAFPDDTKRSFEKQSDVICDRKYNFCKVGFGDLFVGVFAYWDLGLFLFVEHFAVDKNLRDKGFGTDLLQDFVKCSDKLVILEVHKPDTEIDKRRIGFYERNGFKLNEFDYLQPPYENGKKAVPLFVMSYPRPLHEAEFVKIRKLLHTEVYGLDEVLV